MTREEAITELNTFKIGAKSELGENALNMAIKALEQEPILDKIRAEIEQVRQDYEASMDYTDGAREQALSWVLEVIDKYKAETEDNNGRML